MKSMSHIYGTAAMSEYAAQFVTNLEPQMNHATIVTLSGELGAGKTTFVQGIARALGIEETVASPTFVIEKVYELGDSDTKTRALFSNPNDTREREKVLPPLHHWTHLIHIDAYRIKNKHELEVLGWHEITADPGNLIVIEWPEMVAELIPADAIRVTLRGDGNVREISFSKK
jgi:tRNA threonylcarbamoyladenosine biosynthesis protein TsaE